MERVGGREEWICCNSSQWELGRDKNKKSWWVFQLERDTNNVIRNGKQKERMGGRKKERRGWEKEEERICNETKGLPLIFHNFFAEEYLPNKEKLWRRRWWCKEKKKEEENKSDGKTNMPVDEYYWRLTELELKSKRKEWEEFNEKERIEVSKENGKGWSNDAEHAILSFHTVTYITSSSSSSLVLVKEDLIKNCTDFKET